MKHFIRGVINAIAQCIIYCRSLPFYVRQVFRSLGRQYGRFIGRLIPKFPYERLEDDGKSFRLLVLHPPIALLGFRAVPTLDLITFDLEDEEARPQFCALSYTWGVPTPPTQPELYDEEQLKIIVVNGRWFQVKPNLFFAIQQISKNFFKDRNDPVWIWIDAICIDQQNTEEKNSQVRLMKQIYSKSWGTVVWLGPADSGTEKAFSKLISIAEDHVEKDAAATEQGVDPAFGYLEPYMIMLGRRLTESETFRQRSLELDDLNQIEGIPEIRELMKRCWWERSWVWQEVTCARTALFMCGPYETDFNVLVKVSFAIMTDEFTSARFGDPIDTIFLKELQALFLPISKMARMRHIMAPMSSNATDQSSIEVNIVLENIRHTMSTDPRDKVFAGLGLCDRSHGVSINYDSPIEHVYTDVVQRHVATKQNLDILGYCQYPPLLENLPSWVPDWTDTVIKRHPLGLEANSLRKTQHLYSAGGLEGPIVEISRDSPNAKIQGLILRNILFVATEEESPSHGVPGGRYSSRVGSQLWHGVSALLQCIWLRQWAELEPYGGVHNAQVELFRPKVFRRGLLKRRIRFRGKGPWMYDPDRTGYQFEKLSYKLTGEPLLHAYIRTIYADSMVSFSQSQKRRFKDWHSNPTDGNADSVLVGRTFATTEFDDFALVPVETEFGDQVVLFKGAQTLHILRPTPQGYLLIGDCYLHGYMDGEYCEIVEELDKWDMIELI